MITAASGLNTNFSLATTKVSFGGVAYGLTLSAAGSPSTATAEIVTVTGTGLDQAYWTGAAGSVWNAGVTNWNTSATSGTAVSTQPGNLTDVFFATTSPPPTVLTGLSLGMPYTINSLNFLSGVGAVSIANDINNDVLTINGGALGNIGINDSSANPVTLSLPIALGGIQSWTNSGAGLLTTAAVNNGGFLLTTAGTGNVTIGGALTGAGGLNVTGTGTVTLSATGNTYTGLTTIRGGVLSVPSGTITATNTLDVGSSSGAVVAISGGAVTATSAVRIGMSQTGNLTSNGTLYLSNGSLSAGGDSTIGFVANTGGVDNATVYQTGGAYNQSAGTFYLGVNNAVGTTTTTYNVFGGTLTAGNTILGGNGNGTISSTLNVNGTAAVTFATVTSNQTVNTDTVNLNGGTLTTGAWTTAATGTTFNFNGGILKANASSAAFLGASTTPLNLYAGGATINTNGQTMAITEALQNPANSGLTGGAVSGAGSATFSTPQPLVFTGGTGSGAAGYATINSAGQLNGIVLTNIGSYTVAPTISVAGATGATFTQPTLTANSAGGLTVSGGGTLRLSGTDTYAGGTTVSSGILDYLNTAAEPATGVTTVAAAGTLGLGVGGTGFFNSANVDSLFANTLPNVSMDPAAGVAIDTTAGNFVYATNQSAARALTKLGANTLTLSGTDTYTGPTTITAGTLNVTGSISAASAVTINGGTLSGTGTVGNVTLTSGGIAPGPGSTIGTLTTGAVSVAAGTSLSFVLGSPSNASLLSATALTLPTSAASVTFNLADNLNAGGLGSPGANGVYPIINYTSLNGGNATFTSTFKQGTIAASLSGHSFGFYNTGSGVGTIYLGVTQSPLIYQDTFNRTGNLNGSSPALQTGTSSTWTASTYQTATTGGGQLTITANAASGDLPFVPVTGKVYTYSVNLNPTGTNGDWFAIGFSNGTLTGSPNSANIILWMLERNSGTGQSFYGTQNGNQATWATAINGLQTNTIAIDTTGSNSVTNATVYWYVSGALQRTATGVNVSTATNIIVGGNGAASGTAQNLTLSTGGTWNVNGGGSWNTAANWAANALPNAAGAAATLPPVINGTTLTATQSAIITLDANQTVGLLTFANSTSGGGNYTIQADAANDTANSLILNNSGNGAVLTNYWGSNVISAPVNFADNVQAVVSAGSTLAISGAISDTGSGSHSLAVNPTLTTGTLILSNPLDTWGGGTTIYAGTLQLGDGTTFNGGITGNITDNGTLAFANPNPQTYAGVISGTGSLTKNAAGLLILSNANTFSGATNANAGTLQLNNSLALQNSTVSINVNNGVTFNTGLGAATFGGLAGSGNAALQDSTPSAVNLTVGGNNANTRYTGALSGAGGLTKVGTGTLTLAGFNTYAGNTAITAGTLQLGATLSAASADVQFTSDATSGIGTAGTGATGYTVALAFAQGANLSINGVTFTNTGTATNGSNWSVTNWPNNNVSGNFATGFNPAAGQQTNALLNHFYYGAGGTGYTQTLTISGLTPGESYDARIYYRSYGTPAPNQRVVTWTLDGGTGSPTTLSSVNEDANATGNYLDFTYVAGAAGTLNMSAVDAGAGSWHLYGFSNQLILGQANQLPTTTALTIASGATFDLNGSSQQVVSLGNISGGGGTVTNSSAGTPVLTLAPTGTTTFGGTIANGSGGGVTSLTINGSGTQILTGASTFSGATNVNAGTLQVGNSLALQNSTVTLNETNGLTFTAGLGTATFGGLAGSGNLALQDLASPTPAAISLSVGNNNANSTYSGALSGPGSLTKIGTGTLTLSGGNSFAGPTVVSGGTLQLQNPTFASPVAHYALNGNVNDSSGNGLNGTLNGTGTSYVAGRFGQALSFPSGNSTNWVSVAGSATSPLNLSTYTVSAWFNLAAQPTGVDAILGTRFGANGDTFDMKYQVSGGTYSIHGDIGFGSNWLNTNADYTIGATPLSLNTWHLVTYEVTTGTYSIFVDGTEVVTNASYATNPGAGNGSTTTAPVFMSSTNTLGIGQETGGEFFSSGAIDDVQIFGSVLTSAQVAAMYSGSSLNVLPVATAVQIASGSTLDLNGVSQQVASLANASGGLVTTSSAYPVTLTLTPTATSTTFGGVIQNGNGTVSLVVNGTGTGTQILSGTNTYTGPTTILGGSLRVNGSLAAGSAITVGGTTAGGASGNPTLGGSGTINGSVTVVGSGTGNVIGHLAPSGFDASAGVTLTLTSSLTLGNNSILDFNLSNSTSGANDLVSITGSGAVAYGASGTLNINAFNGPLASGTYVLIQDTSSTTPTGGTGWAVGMNNATNNNTYVISVPTSGTYDNDLILTVTANAPSAAYWYGIRNDGNWSTSSSGTNWVGSPTSTTDLGSIPGNNTDVVETANTATNLSNQSLGGPLAINSLTFTGAGTPNTAGVTIAAGNTLTINALASASGGLGYAAGTGIVVQSGSGANTINANVSLANSQTWTNNSANTLTIGGAISGSSAVLTTAGSGMISLSGNNTYTGGTTIAGGTLRIGVSNSGTSTGALGPSSASVQLGAGSGTNSASLLTGGAFTFSNAITVAASSGTLKIGGATDNNSTFSGPITLDNNLTISQVANAGSNALSLTGGIMDNGSVSYQLTFAGPGNINVSGAAITDSPPFGEITVAITGGSTTFSVANTYSGNTSITAGTLKATNTNGSAVGTGNVLVSGTGALAGSASTGQGFLGTNANPVTVTIQSGGTIVGTTQATLTINNALTLQSGALANFSTLSSSDDNNGAAALIKVTGNFMAPSSASTITVTVPSGLSSGTYDLISFGTALGGFTNSTFAFNGGAPSGYSFVVTSSQLDLSVASATNSPMNAVNYWSASPPNQVQFGTANNWHVQTNNGYVGIQSNIPGTIMAANSPTSGGKFLLTDQGTSANPTQGNPLYAAILAGTNSGTYTGGMASVNMSWRARALQETDPQDGGQPAAPPLQYVGSYLISNVLNLTGLGGSGAMKTYTSSSNTNYFGTAAVVENQTDPFVLQMNYNVPLLSNEGGQAKKGTIYLGWLEPADPTANGFSGPTWEKAVTGDFGSGNASDVAQNYQGPFLSFVNAVVAAEQNNSGNPFFDATAFTSGTLGSLTPAELSDLLGSYGVDPSSGAHDVWAVINHNSQFAVVPEPSTLLLAALGLLGVAGYKVRRRKQ